MAAIKNYTLLLCLPLLLLFGAGAPAPSENEKLMALLRQFATEYRALHMPGLSMSYVERMQTIQDAQGLARQEQLFSKTAGEVKSINADQLTGKYKLYYRQLRYELDLNQRRVALQQQYRKLATSAPSDQGILQQPLGREFYRYWLQEYLSLPVTPEDLKAFGMQEVRKVQQEIKKVQAQLGFANDSAGFYAHLNDSRFILGKEREIIKRYQQKYKVVVQHLPDLFYTTDFRELYFAKIEDAHKDTPPGIYTPHNTSFQFNLYQ